MHASLQRSKALRVLPHTRESGAFEFEINPTTTYADFIAAIGARANEVVLFGADTIILPETNLWSLPDGAVITAVSATLVR